MLNRIATPAGASICVASEQPDGTELTERVVCVAYPDGIPDRIAYGDPETMEVADLHLEVQPDQVGEKVFEESEEE